MDSMLVQELGEKIRLLRQSKNMAEMLHMSPSGYAKIEKGQSDSNVSRMEQIAKVFGMTVTQLSHMAERSMSVKIKHAKGNRIGNTMHNQTTYEINNYADGGMEDIVKLLKEIMQRLDTLEK